MRIAKLAFVHSFEDSGGHVYLRIFSAPSENIRAEDGRNMAGIAGIAGIAGRFL